MAENSTRALRTRQVVALMAWAGLVCTAYWLSNARYLGTTTLVTPAPIAFVLASFTAFIGVFAWMLYNPARRSAVESPKLSVAAAATLFPPPIIGFCLLPPDSPLRGWLALGLFLLCVIAILSHVPDDFFGVPRNRYSYLVPIPAFDGVKDDALDPDAAWFKSADLTGIVADTERPSLAPRAYLQTDRERSRTKTQKADVKPATSVDDILSSEIDVSLLDDPLWDLESDSAESAAQNFASPELDPSDQNRPRDRQKRVTAGAPEGRADSEARTVSRSPRWEQSKPRKVSPQPDLRTQTGHSQEAADDPSDQSSFLMPTPPLSNRFSNSVETKTSDEDATETEHYFERAYADEEDTYSPPAARSQSPAAGATSPELRDRTESDVAEPSPSEERPRQTAKTRGKAEPQIQRTVDDNGAELVEGVLKVRFDKGQKRANLHVPFSPPLTGVPEVECECVGGEPLRLKVPVRQSYGIRIEARRSNADEELETEVGFAAVTSDS